VYFRVLLLLLLLLLVTRAGEEKIDLGANNSNAGAWESGESEGTAMKMGSNGEILGEVTALRT